MDDHEKNPLPPTAKGTSNFNMLLSAVGESQDRQAFIQLFAHFAPRLKSWLMGKGESETIAEEVIQNTFIAVWEKAKLYDPEKSCRQYMALYNCPQSTH